MDDGLQRQDEIAAAVEDALRTYPLTPEPRTLLPEAMAAVRALAERPRLRLGWLEWALGLFVLLMGGVTVWIASLMLPGDWLAQVRMQGTILWQALITNRLLGAALAAVILLIGGIVAVAGMALVQPRYSLHYK